MIGNVALAGCALAEGTTPNGAVVSIAAAPQTKKRRSLSIDPAKCEASIVGSFGDTALSEPRPRLDIAPADD
jgi:hypothetical protein